MTRASKSQIAKAITHELSIFGVGHPYAIECLEKWLINKWHPAQTMGVSVALMYEQWKTPGVEWTPIQGYGYCVLKNTPESGLVAWVSGVRIYSAVIDAAYQERLSTVPRSQINKIAGCEPLFNLAEYEEKNDDNETVYTHADG